MDRTSSMEHVQSETMCDNNDLLRLGNSVIRRDQVDSDTSIMEYLLSISDDTSNEVSSSRNGTMIQNSQREHSSIEMETNDEMVDNDYVQEYVRGDTVPLFEIDSTTKSLLRKKKNEHVQASMSRRIGTHRVNRKTITENLWYIVPTRECEIELLQYIRRTYRFNEVYEKDTTCFWRDYNGEPIVLIRCYGKQKKRRFFQKLEQWIGTVPFESDVSRKYTRRPKIVDPKKYHVLLLTDFILPKEFRSCFKQGNIKNPKI